MKKQYIYIITALVVAFNATAYLVAQPNSLYFMNYLPYQAYMNPAIQPACKVYVELPGLSTWSLSAGNNSVSLNDIFYLHNGQMITALHPEYGDRDKLYNSFKNTTNLSQDFSMSLFGFGFKLKEKGYLSINASIKQETSAYMPKDFVKLALYGTPDENAVNTFNLRSLGFGVNSYMDISGGYSYILNEKVTVGARVKLLSGIANARMGFSSLELQVSQDAWRIVGEGSMQLSAPAVEVLVDGEQMIDNILMPEDPMAVLQNLKPNLGLGFDMGAVYKPIENLTLSGAISDVGFISWQNGYKQKASVDFIFEGIEVDINNMEADYADSLLTVLKDSYTVEEAKNGYTSALKSKIYLGAEYAFLDDKMSAGILSKTIVENSQLFGEVTVSVNARPLSWVGATLSYSLLNGGLSSLGAGVNLRLPPFSFYVASDYIPLYYNGAGVPYKMTTFNLQTGMVLTFGCKKKKDKIDEKSTQMLQMQDEMNSVEKDASMDIKTKKKDEEYIYQPVQRMQDPTGVLQKVENGEVTPEDAQKKGVMQVATTKE